MRVVLTLAFQPPKWWFSKLVILARLKFISHFASIGLHTTTVGCAPQGDHCNWSHDLAKSCGLEGMLS